VIHMTSNQFTRWRL